MRYWHVPEAMGWIVGVGLECSTKTGERYENIIMHNTQLIIGLQRGIMKNKNIMNIFTSSVRETRKKGKRKTQLNEMKKVLISTPARAKIVTRKKRRAKWSAGGWQKVNIIKLYEN